MADAINFNEYLVKTLLQLQVNEEFYLAIVNPETMTREYNKLPKIRYYGYLETDTNSSAIVKFHFDSNYELKSDCILLNEEDYKKAKDDILSGKATLLKRIELSDYSVGIYLFAEFSYENTILIIDDSEEDNIFTAFLNNNSGNNMQFQWMTQVTIINND